MNFLGSFFREAPKAGFFWGLIFLSFCACDSSLIFDDNHPVPGRWKQSETIPFDVVVEDTLSNYDLMIHVRNNGFYRYKDLYLLVYLQSPPGEVTVDTLKLSVVDVLGRRTGKGIGDLRSHTLMYKQNHHFSASGLYAFRITHYIKSSEITGILDLGMTVKSIQ